MKRRLLAIALLACAFPATAQTPAPTAPAAKPAPAPDYNAGGLPRTPSYGTIEGQPVDARPFEKKRDTRQFAEQTRAPYRKSTDFKVEVLTDKLSAAWAVAHLPDGKYLITERLPGQFRLLDKGNLSAPLTGLDGLKIGTPMMALLDVVLDPEFAKNRTIFFTYTEYHDRTIGNTSIARAVLDVNSNSIRDVKVLLKTNPFLPNDQTLSMGTKTGGRIAIGKDGFLYVSIGDRDNAGTRPWGVAQVNDTHLGKVVRITKDGAPAPGNPFIGVAGALPEIWAIGFRSQEGLAFDPKGTLWQTEHGPRGGDELNIIERGKNYGWPIISHGIDYRGGDIAEGEVVKAGMEQPAYYWSPSVAVAGLAFYTGKSSAWKDSVFIGLLNGRGVSRLKLVNNKVVEEEVMLTDRKARIRDVRMGNDGSILVVTDSGGTAMSVSPPATGQLLKLTPAR
jgi:glucose/arabinose dehydrogenase